MHSNDHQSTEENSSGAAVQRSLAIGSAHSPMEQEAESMADRVMRMPESSLIQRKCAHCEEEEVQRKPLTSFIQKKGSESGTRASHSVSQQINASKGNGNRLDGGTRSFMQKRFGTDFSNVNIHTGTDAIQMSTELSAKAFTVGNDIYFNEGQYNPNSREGRHLLAHELTHTVQQGKSESIQRSCSDGNCDTCAGGMKNIVVTAFFRRRADRATMQVLRTKITEAKRILRNCCINLFVNFNWGLLPGGGTFDPGVARAAGSPNGAWDYTNDSETLGEGTTFSGVTGIPMLVVDTVPRTGGGVTISSDFNTEYTGNPYIVMPVGHGRDRSIAHELGHVAHILGHTIPGVMDNAGGTATSDPYCNAVRAIAN